MNYFTSHVPTENKESAEVQKGPAISARFNFSWGVFFGVSNVNHFKYSVMNSWICSQTQSERHSNGVSGGDAAVSREEPSPVIFPRKWNLNLSWALRQSVTSDTCASSCRHVPVCSPNRSMEAQRSADTWTSSGGSAPVSRLLWSCSPASTVLFLL